MSKITIAGVDVRQDAQGRYSLNDLHRASGGENRHRPSLWAENQQTQALIAEVEGEAGNPALVSVKGGAASGTFVCKELVYAYAMWISARFHLEVIRAYDRKVTGQDQALSPANMSRLQLLEMAMQAEQERLALESKVQEQAPKVEVYERIADAEGSITLRETANTLQVPERKFILMLQEHDWIYRRAGHKGLLAYSDKVKAGYLVLKQTPVRDIHTGEEKLSEQVRVTPLGMTALARALPRWTSPPTPGLPSVVPWSRGAPESRPTA